jgi:photosystem II stability/assembly factor-like uncharacterized protein
MKARFEPVGVTAPTVEANASGYTAELWKSVDGGKTWKSLFSDEGSFYFNDISCFGDTCPYTLALPTHLLYLHTCPTYTLALPASAPSRA